MPIITCPDCGHHPVSDRAPTCPKCGCPIAMTNVSSGSANASAVAPGPLDANQSIAQLESMVKEAERELLTPDQAQDVVRRIAEFKRTAFSSRDAFVEASIANRLLVLGDEDVDILKSLNDDQRPRIKALYALGCDRLDGTMLGSLNGFRNLAILDMSYSNGLSVDEMRIAFNNGDDLSVLGYLYLRRNRRLYDLGLSKWLGKTTHLEGLFLDGNVQLHDFCFYMSGLPSLRTLSVRGCSKLTERDARAVIKKLEEPYCQLKIALP